MVDTDVKSLFMSTWLLDYRAVLVSPSRIILIHINSGKIELSYVRIYIRAPQNKKQGNC